MSDAPASFQPRIIVFLDPLKTDVVQSRKTDHMRGQMVMRIHPPPLFDEPQTAQMLLLNAPVGLQGKLTRQPHKPFLLRQTFPPIGPRPAQDLGQNLSGLAFFPTRHITRLGVERITRHIDGQGTLMAIKDVPPLGIDDDAPLMLLLSGRQKT